MIYVVWSIEHDAWWRPEWNGYTQNLGEAGLYSADESARILERANLVRVNEARIPITAVCAVLANASVSDSTNDADEPPQGHL